MYPKFLDMGYSPFFFWECSLAEVVDLFDSYRRREDRRQKEKDEAFKVRALSLQVLALQIRDAVWGEKDSDFRTVQHFYPTLFPETEKVDRELIKRNERMRRFAEEHNRLWQQAHSGKEES